MAVDEQEFRSLYSLLMGPMPAAENQEDAPQPRRAAMPRFPGPWDAQTLASAVAIFGVMGCDRFGVEGSFLQDSPEANEALGSLASFLAMLDQAALDPETATALAQGVDRRTQAFWGWLEDEGPLHRYGWADDDGFPPLDKIAAGALKPKRPQALHKEINNDRKLIGALACALLGKGGFPNHGAAVSMDSLAKDIESWAKSRGIRGLGEGTVKDKLRAALQAVVARDGS